MKEITLYHNPRCSKSRQALQLLLDHQCQPQIIEYLKTPLTESELSALLKRLNLSAREIMRKNEPPYKELSLDNPIASEKQLIKALIEYPILMERPIVVVGQQAIIARPPEKLLELL